jgi:hypothetical protein
MVLIILLILLFLMANLALLSLMEMKSSVAIERALQERSEAMLSIEYCLRDIQDQLIQSPLPLKVFPSCHSHTCVHPFMPLTLSTLTLPWFQQNAVHCKKGGFAYGQLWQDFPESTRTIYRFTLTDAKRKLMMQVSLEKNGVTGEVRRETLILS